MSAMTARIQQYTMVDGRPRLRCGRCGRYGTADRMVFSLYTGGHFCEDTGACARRARRRDHIDRTGVR